ncbi:MAG: PAS domain S-box protein [Terriglobia bacterium]
MPTKLRSKSKRPGVEPRKTTPRARVQQTRPASGRARPEALQRANSELEKRTRQITAELKKANKKLQIEILQRQKMTEALIESERRLYSIMESSPSIIFMKDVSGRYVYVNPEFQKICRLGREEVMGKTDSEVFPPAQAQAFRANDLRVLQTGAPLSFEETAIQADGSHTSVVTKFPLRDSEGRIHQICGIVTDITERKRIEESLRDNEIRLRLMLGQIPAIVWTTDKDLKVTSSSGAGLTRFNFMPNHNTGLTLYEILQVHNPDSLPIAAHLNALKGKSIQYAYEWLGATYQVHVEPLRGAAGEIEGCVGLALDVSERRKAEEQLRESEFRFRSITESANQAIITGDAAGAICSWNGAAQKLFGYTEAEARGKTIGMLMPERYRAAHEDGIKRLRSGGQPLVTGSTIDAYGLRKDGAEFPLELSLSRWQAGENVFYTGIISDTSLRKQAEDSLRRLSGLLLRVQDEERRRMARELHDSTAQTLSALSLNLALINQCADLSHQPKASQALSESIDLAGQAARELRTFSYLLHPPLLDEAGLADALQWYVSGFTQRTNIQVNVTIFPCPLGRLDPEIEMALFRVAQESLTNVYRHSGSQTARIRLAVTGSKITLEVRDEGKGLPSGWSMLDDESEAMMGVGIRGMRERVRQLGGRLEIRPGRPGTRVEVVLPHLHEDVPPVIRSRAKHAEVK